MDPFIYDQAKRILDKFCSKPIAAMLKENWTDLSGQLTLDKILEKFNSKVYASLFDLYLDIRLLLEQKDPQNPINSTKNLILADLTQWITRKFFNIPRSPEELDYFKTRKLVQKVNLIFGAMIVKPENYSLPSQNYDSFNSIPSSSSLSSSSSSLNSLPSTDFNAIYSSPSTSILASTGNSQIPSSKSPLVGQKRIEVLQQRIEHLKTPQELQEILKILQKHIPQFTLAPEVVIEGRFITKACANDLRDYLNSINE